jgi:cytochrome c oxidase subunit 2
LCLAKTLSTIIFAVRSGRKITVDEAYLKDAILHPGKDVVKGYPDVMPPQGNNVSEEELLAIIRYLKGLK